MKKPNGYWNYERCYEEAMKCKTLVEFKKEHHTAYSIAVKHKWLEHYYWLERIHKPHNYWSYENCYNYALKCKTLNEFRTLYASAERAARKNGWIKDYVWFERSINVFEDKVDNVYAYVFNDLKSVYIGRTINLKERDENHHKYGSVFNFAKENGLDVPNQTLLETNITLVEGLIYENLYEEQYKSDGWNILNKAKTGLHSGSLGTIGKHKWSKKKCFEAAAKCKGRGEFHDKYYRAWKESVKNNWIDEMFPIVQHKPRAIKQYTLEGEYMCEYESIAEAARLTNNSHGNIQSCCCGKRKSAGGSIWKYADEETKKAA